MLKQNNVDGVYDSDPKVNPQARMFDHLEFMEALNLQLEIIDSTALSLCMDNNLPIIVFDLFKPGIIKRTLSGEVSGTLISRRA